MVRKEEEDQGCAFQMAVGWNILDNERKDPTVERLKVLARSMQFLKGRRAGMQRSGGGPAF